MSDMPASIAAALVKAQREARDVVKDGVNAYHKYAYATSEDIAQECKRALNANGLALCRVGWSSTQPTEHAPGNVLVRYALVHDSGDSWLLPEASCPVCPEKGRPEDKATAAALTFSAGYVALGLLQIERVDEHAPDARNDTDRGKHQQTRRQSPLPGRPAKSAMDVRPMLLAFEAIKPGEIDRCMKMIDRANEHEPNLSDADYEAVGKAIESAKLRAEEAPAKPAGNPALKPPPGKQNLADVATIVELSTWIAGRREMLKTLPREERDLVRQELTEAARRLNVDHAAMLHSAGL